MTCLDRWSFLKVTLFYIVNEGLLKSGVYFQGDLYSEVIFNNGLTVDMYIYILLLIRFCIGNLLTVIKFNVYA
jgi:hypothetical protein